MESGRIAPLRHGKEIVAARRSVSKAALFKLLWILMTTFYIEQFGCRATQADAAAIERQLRDRGFVAASGSACADVVIVNTCTVTAAGLRACNLRIASRAWASAAAVTV